MTATAITRCLPTLTTGRLVTAHRHAISASARRSFDVSPITDGISSIRPERPSSVVWSLTTRASPASSGWVQDG